MVSDNIYTEIMRAKLDQPAPPPGWTNPEPYSGESHYVSGHDHGRPVCGLVLYYSGDRFEQPPEGTEACEECKAAQP